MTDHVEVPQWRPVIQSSSEVAPDFTWGPPDADGLRHPVPLVGTPVERGGITWPSREHLDAMSQRFAVNWTESNGGPNTSAATPTCSRTNGGRRNSGRERFTNWTTPPRRFAPNWNDSGRSTRGSGSGGEGGDRGTGWIV